MCSPEIIPLHLARAVAYTDGVGRVWVDPRLTAVERRCALVHEHRHLANGDTCHSERAERRARRETALILLPTLPQPTGDLTPHQIAAEHEVTLSVLTDRLLIERGEL